jgi:hypothetical protein
LHKLCIRDLYSNESKWKDKILEAIVSKPLILIHLDLSFYDKFYKPIKYIHFVNLKNLQKLSFTGETLLNDKFLMIICENCIQLTDLYIHSKLYFNS